MSMAGTEGQRIVTPAALVLFVALLGPPVVWLTALQIGYAFASYACDLEMSRLPLHVTTIAALAIVAAGATLSWNALQRTMAAEPTDGGMPRQRAKFMALLGLMASALFALQVIAAWYPRWILDACR